MVTHWQWNSEWNEEIAVCSHLKFGSHLEFEGGAKHGLGGVHSQKMFIKSQKQFESDMPNSLVVMTLTVDGWTDRLTTVNFAKPLWTSGGRAH